MGVGKYNKRLLIQQPPTGQDAAGAPATVFTDFATVWAQIAPIKGAEAVTAGQTLASMDTRIHIRHHPALAALNEKWRCSYNGVTYNITSVANVNLANTEIELLCNSGKNQG